MPTMTAAFHYEMLLFSCDLTAFLTIFSLMNAVFYYNLGQINNLSLRLLAINTQLNTLLFLI